MTTLPHVFLAARNRGATARLRPNYSTFTKYYDFLVGDPAHGALTRAFASHSRRVLQAARTLADVGCGTGRFLAWLARSPLALYGVDTSAEALAVARKRLAPGRAVLLKQDIRSLALPELVDVVTCHNQTINYLLTREDLRRAFEAVSRNLKAPGAFFFDFIARPPAGERAPVRSLETIRLPDVTAQFESRVDAAQSRSTVTVIFKSTGGGTPSKEVHRQRWYPPRSISRLLRLAGFTHIDMRPVSSFGPSQWLYVTALRG